MVLVNTGSNYPGRCGAGTWWGGGALGRLRAASAAQATRRKKSTRLVTHLHSDHVGGLTTQTEIAFFQMPRSTSRRQKATFGCRPKSLLSGEGCATLLQSAQPSQRRNQGGKWHTFSGSEPIVDGMQSSAAGHTPDISAMNFVRGTKILFGRHLMHSESTASIRVTAIFDIDQTAAAARGINCCLSSRARMF